MQFRSLMTILCTVALMTAASAQNQNPRVPPGRAPVGAPVVAFISTGVNYTLPEIANRLARDGEGDVIGWDFADGDHRPFDESRGRTPNQNGGDGTALANLMLSQSADVRLAPVRFDPAQPASAARALAFAGQTPARVVLITASSAVREDWEMFGKAAQHFKKLLVVVAVDGASAPAGARMYPAGLELDNILVVAAKDTPPATAIGFDGALLELPPAFVAAAQMAARAAEEAQKSPDLDGAALRTLMQSR